MPELRTSEVAAQVVTIGGETGHATGCVLSKCAEDFLSLPFLAKLRRRSSCVSCTTPSCTQLCHHNPLLDIVLLAFLHIGNRGSDMISAVNGFLLGQMREHLDTETPV
jgi:hypothetical protein